MVSINVAQLLQDPVGSVRDFDYSERIAVPEAELALREPVRGHIHLTRTPRGVLVSATHQTRVQMECSRCLAEVIVPVEGVLEEEFIPSTDLRTGLPVETDEDDPDQQLIDDHHEIHLDDLLRQEILTDLPLKPLCEAACPGLCPTCGERLSPGHPEHPESAPEPEAEETTRPFAHLADMLRAANPTTETDGRPRGRRSA